MVAMENRDETLAPSRRQILAAAGATLAACALHGTTGCAAPTREGADDEPARPEGLSAALGSSWPTFPLAGTTSPGALSVLRHVTEGLFDLDPHTFKAYRALAAGSPVAVGELEYDVALREGAAFADGTPVTAEMVAATFKSLQDSSGAYSALLAPIASMAAVDDATVRITLAHPFPLLLERRLALVQVVRDAGVWTAHDGTLSPVTLQGSGPWALESSSPEEGRLRFAPNEHYAGERPATCPSMEWRFLADGSDRAAALAAGEVLVADDLDGAHANKLGMVDSTLEYVPGFASPYLMFNCEKAPFSDLRVRQALLYAIDYDLAIAQVFGGRATAPTGVLPETHQNYLRAKTVYSHDAERARSLLEKAETQDLTLALALQDESMRPLAERIVADWAQAGVTATIDSRGGALVGSVANYDVAVCFDDPTLLGFDVDLILTWRYGGFVAPESLCRWSGEAADEARALMQQARETADEGLQRQLWEQCFEIISAQVPLYPVAFLEAGTAWRSGALRGFEPLTTDGVDLLGVELR